MKDRTSLVTVCHIPERNREAYQKVLKEEGLLRDRNMFFRVHDFFLSVTDYSV